MRPSQRPSETPPKTPPKRPSKRPPKRPSKTPPTLARRALAVASILLIGCGAACKRESAPAAPPPVPAAEAPAVIDASDPTATADLELEPADASAEPRPDAAPDMVKIKLVADQRAQAHVFWGRKELGIAPVEVMRPRGSGPLDLLVLAEGYLPLHTRAFTERSETLSLRLVPAAAAPGLPGYTPPPPDAGASRANVNRKNPGPNPTTKAKPERP
jgi:hypothetical protein